MNHCHLNHALTRLRKLFIIFTETTIPSQPAEGPLHHPTLRQELEATLVVAPLDGDQLPAAFTPLTVDQPLLLIDPIHPYHLHPWATILDESQHRRGRLVILHVRRRDHHRDQEP